MNTRATGRSTLERLLPRRLRVELFHVRSRGAAGYARYRWRRRALRHVQPPPANAPYDIGGLRPIVLPASVVRGFAAHFVDRGGGTAELDAFKRLAAGHTAFLDIGAGAGLFAAAFCALTGNTAYAFEPAPANFARMQELAAANPDLAIQPFKVALGESAGTQAASAPSALGQFRGVSDADAATHTMTVDTLDAFAAARGLAPDFAKVDVEGMELAVLRGGHATFAGSVDALMLELHPRLLLGGASVADVEAELRALGFTILTIELEPIEDLARYVADHRGAARVTNLVCRKRAG